MFAIVDEEEEKKITVRKQIIFYIGICPIFSLNSADFMWILCRIVRILTVILRIFHLELCGFSIMNFANFASIRISQSGAGSMGAACSCSRPRRPNCWLALQLYNIEIDKVYIEGHA